MSLALFSLRNKYYKNGIWWFTKIIDRVVGQQTYNSIRVSRRVFSNKFYYLRQHLLYRIFIESPDVGNMIGIYPKTDTTHGYGSNIHYEMYRDFQENTINGDGSFGMWIVYIAVLYSLHTMYSYIMPWYWNKNASCKNGEQQRFRMKDALSSTVLQDTYVFQIMEWGFNPHYTYYVKHKLTEGLSHPDDVHAMSSGGLNRYNRYRQHYVHRNNHKMIAPF